MFWFICKKNDILQELEQLKTKIERTRIQIYQLERELEMHKLTSHSRGLKLVYVKEKYNKLIKKYDILLERCLKYKTIIDEHPYLLDVSPTYSRKHSEEQESSTPPRKEKLVDLVGEVMRLHNELGSQTKSV